MSVPVAFGTPDAVLQGVVILPFNDPDLALSILDDHRRDIACVIVDPMPHRVGLVPVDAGYLRVTSSAGSHAPSTSARMASPW